MESEFKMKKNLNTNITAAIDTLNISDIIDIEMLKSIMEDFYNITGMLGALIDISGQVLIAVGWQDICTKFHRCNANSLKHCIESDTTLTKGVAEGTFKTYKCKNNMTDVVTPLIIDGKHLANIFIGQYIPSEETLNIETFRTQARKYKFDEEKYIAALKVVPRFSKEQINTGMQFYAKLAKIISTLSLNTIKQLKLLNELNNSEEALQHMFDLSPSIIAKVNIKDGYFIKVNKAVTKIFGYTIEEFKSIPFMELIHPDDRHSAADEILEQIAGYDVTFFENRYLCKDGSYKWTAWHGTKSDENGIVTAIGIDIHDRKKIEQELVESEKKYRDLVNLAQEGIWVINKDNITSFANPSMAEMLGYSIEEMIEKSLFYFMDEKGVSIAECLLEQRKVGIKDERDFEFIHRTGYRIMASVETAPILDENGNYDGIIAGVMDVTKRRQAKAKLQESEKIYRSLFEKAPLGTAYHQMIYDESGKPINYRILEVNQKYQALTGLVESPVGKLVTEVFPGIEKDPFDWINAFGNVAKTGKEINFQQKLQSNNRWYNLVAYQNKPDHFVATFFEITEQKLGEIELVAAKEKAEESDRLKSAFLTNMSHEIRTPLNAVIGFSEILYRNHLSDEEKATFTKYIRLNGESLVKIIDDIIDISALQSNQITIDNYDFNLPALFDELDNYYNSVLVQKSKTNIKLVLKLPEAVKYSFFIKSDEPRLKQILNNLISNAIKYTETGQITFGCKLEESNLYFYVKDTGYGIAPENIESIFERFKQYSSQYVSKHEGTGLGLSICKQLVILLGGELSVKSKVGKGSTFYFSIPLVKAAYPIQSKEPIIMSENKSLLNYKILIADDEELNYEMLKRMLKPSKVSTDWAKHGKQALELAVTTKYDLILMDIKMPEMDGIEATRLIKKHDKNIPIIIQTAFAMKEIKDEAIEAGCDGFIAKPIGLDPFMKLIHKHIGV